jgi:hypothetical protein
MSAAMDAENAPTSPQMTADVMSYVLRLTIMPTKLIAAKNVLTIAAIL